MTPVTVIGGYLGAGKTTLINHMLRHADGVRLAVLVNEFGDLAIDADLIEAQDDGIIAIAGGCICCAFGDNLVGALMDLARLSPAPDHVIIEASGVAIPGAIAASLSLVTGFRVNGLAVLADAETIRQGAQDRYLGDTIQQQLQDADLVILTKTDLVGADQLEALREWMADLTGSAMMIEAQHGRVPNDVVLGPAVTHREYRQGTHADTGYESHVLVPSGPVDARTLGQSLATGGFGIVRAKGFVRDVSGQLMLIQVVGPRSETTPADVGDEGLVCIGLAGQVDLAGIKTLTNSVPSPDSQRLAGSFLALPKRAGALYN